MFQFLIGRIKSFKFAFSGIKWVFGNEKNAQFHALATLIVCLLGFLLELNRIEWIGIVCAIALVLVSELLNTAIEKLADVVSIAYHDKIKIVKDVAAAAVLLASIAAVIIGLIIFLPKIYNFFS